MTFLVVWVLDVGLAMNERRVSLFGDAVYRSAGIKCDFQRVAKGALRLDSTRVSEVDVRSLAFAVCLSVCTIWPAFAEDGVWTPTDTVAQVNVACTRVYTCGPAKPVMYGADKRLVATGNKLVWGVCSAGGGPVDSCNVCVTNPPKERCEWHTEAK